MIEILKSPKHLVAMKLSGGLTAEDVTKAYTATDQALKENERVSFFAEIDESMNLTLEGLAKDVASGIGQFGKLSKYYRAAVVTGKGWVGALARVEGLVFSSIDVRVFSPEERDKAFAWAAEEPEPLPKAAKGGPSIHFIQTNSDRVVAYTIDGSVTEDDVKNAAKVLNEAFDKHEKINVLVRMKDFRGYDLYALLNDELYRMKYKALSKVEKYAVIGAKPWMRNLMELISPLFKMETRVFDESEEAAAWEWVGAQQVLLAGASE
jgi:hypothetical protein